MVIYMGYCVKSSMYITIKMLNNNQYPIRYGIKSFVLDTNVTSTIFEALQGLELTIQNSLLSRIAYN